MEIEKQGSNSTIGKSENLSLDSFISMAGEKGFEVEENKDYGAGALDLVYKVSIHPGLATINCGFTVLRSEEGGSRDLEDNQFSKKIEEATMCGIRSGMDKVYLLAPNEEVTKSITGKVEWLTFFGSLLRLDAISVGISSGQKESAVVYPSQKRVPQGEKIRKQTIRKREAKIERHNKLKAQTDKKQSKEKC
jgi:hypothetical protein